MKRFFLFLFLVAFNVAVHAQSPFISVKKQVDGLGREWCDVSSIERIKLTVEDRDYSMYTSFSIMNSMLQLGYFSFYIIDGANLLSRPLQTGLFGTESCDLQLVFDNGEILKNVVDCSVDNNDLICANCTFGLLKSNEYPKTDMSDQAISYHLSLFKSQSITRVVLYDMAGGFISGADVSSERTNTLFNDLLSPFADEIQRLADGIQ